VERKDYLSTNKLESSKMMETRTTGREMAILGAAAKRFAYFGFSKVTMDEIAADVAMGKASLYYYFPTKESLFKAVLLREKDMFLGGMRSVLERTTSASEELHVYVQKRLELFRTLVNLSTVSLENDKEFIAPFSDFLGELEKEEMKLILQILQEGKREGEFAIQGLQQTASVILHTLHGLRLRTIKAFRRTQFDDRAYDDLMQEGKHLVNLLLQGIAKRK
jgi:TetR/AcrR family transcriptional regulator